MSIPDHKLIPGTGLIVDGFKYHSPVIKAYLLSHAHSGGVKRSCESVHVLCTAVLISPVSWEVHDYGRFTSRSTVLGELEYGLYIANSRNNTPPP